MPHAGCLAINDAHPIYPKQTSQNKILRIWFGKKRARPSASRINQQETIRMLQTGMTVPNFTIPTDTGRFSIADNAGKNVVVFFYPRADTSGCTKESVAFSSLKDDFEAANCVVIGISKDGAAKQGKFRAKHGLTVELGADDASDICEQFGVWVEKSMYGKTYMGIQRATFLIGTDGNIAAVWPKVKVAGHAEEVLETVRGL
jgi:peroxiredoxin Q/BCP